MGNGVYGFGDMGAMMDMVFSAAAWLNKLGAIPLATA